MKHIDRFNLISKILYTLRVDSLSLDFDKLCKFREKYLSSSEKTSIYDVFEKLAYEVSFTEEQIKAIVSSDFNDNVETMKSKLIIIKEVNKFLKQI